MGRRNARTEHSGEEVTCPDVAKVGLNAGFDGEERRSQAESYAEPREKESPTSPEEGINVVVAGNPPCHRLLLLLRST